MVALIDVQDTRIFYSDSLTVALIDLSDALAKRVSGL
jgi:hypothetical protein